MRFIKNVLFLLVLLCSSFVVYAEEKNITDDVIQTVDTSEVEIYSNRHTQMERETVKMRETFSLEEYDKKIENDKLEIWFHEKLASIRIVDKRSGYVWGFVETEKPENLNKSWFEMANSMCTFEYYNEKEAEKKIGLSSEEIEKEYVWSEDTLECKMNAKKLGIELAFTMTLKEECLTFSVVEDSLKESGKAKIKSLYFIPFLGTTQGAEIDGYMFIPDGCGALIRYGEKTEYVAGFDKKIYGLDMGIDTLETVSGMLATRSDDYLVEEPQISMPVYGIVHGAKQHAVLSVVDESEEYASIMANVSGITTEYNWVCASFHFRQSYMHPTTKSGNGIYKPQESVNEIKPQISFYFLNGESADYSGMAVYYRNLLEQKQVLKKERMDEEIPLSLDILGSDIEKGLLYNPLKVFTKVSDTEGMVNELKEEGITNITLTYKGWQDGGINGARFGELDFESNVGSRDDFLLCKDSVVQQGGRFYLYINPVTANTEQIEKARQSLVTISKTYAKKKRADQNLMFPELYFSKPSVTLAILEKRRNKLEAFDVAYDNLGYQLYADYTRDKQITRKETKEEFQKEIALEEGSLALYNPNQYMWPYVSEYFNTPMVNSQYLYETDTVPFMQIVLKGSMDYYAPYANQGFFSDNSILKMIEYGTYPSFIVAQALNYDLAETPQVDLFTVNFHDWKESIVNIYQKINTALVPVEGAKIMEHKAVQPGVYKVIYDNNVSIYVNYNQKNVQIGEDTILASDYLVKREGTKDEK